MLGSEDWRIVQRALAGDSETLSSLFEQDAGKLYRTALLLLRNKEDAQDALQDGLLNAYVNLRSFEGRSQLSTWLRRVVMNAALMNRRRLGTCSFQPLDEFTAGVAPRASIGTGPSPDPEELFARAETRSAVLDAINQLPPALRSAFRLRHIRGLSTLEAARAEGVNVNVIKSRLWRARKQLVSLLNERGVMAHSSPCYDYNVTYTRFHTLFLTGRSLGVLAERTGFAIVNSVRDGDYINHVLSRI